MNFEKALEALNEGKLLSRAAGEYIFQRKEEILKRDLLVYNQQIPQSAKMLLIREGSDVVVLPSYCKYSKGKVSMQWSMSAAEIASEDWQVVEMDASQLTAPQRRDAELATKVEALLSKAKDTKSFAEINEAAKEATAKYSEVLEKLED